MAALLRLWDAFELPANPLDQLTELLGGTDKVSTGPMPKLQLSIPAPISCPCMQLYIVYLGSQSQGHAP